MTYATKLNGQYLMQDGKEVLYPGINGHGWKASVIADGTGFGNPEPLVRTINTLMTQGSWEVYERFGNRDPALVVEIEGLTADGLNAGEVWLSALMKAGSLEWLPPGHTIWTVFDVVTARIDRSYDEPWDLDETRWVRRYLIPIRALPRARSQGLIVTPGEVSVVYDQQIDAGSVTTGWSAKLVVEDNPEYTLTKTVTVVSGAVGASFGPFDSRDITVDASLRRTGTINLTPGRYLRVDWRTKIDSYMNLRIGWSNGTTTGPTITIEAAGGLQQSYFRIPLGLTSTSYLDMFFDVITENPTERREVDQIRLVGELPGFNTRQRVQTIVPGGSAPADGSLHVAHSTTALGKVIVATYPIGRPSPALVQHATTWTVLTADATQINGQRLLIQANDLVLTVPDASLPARGLAALWAKIHVENAPATITWTVTPVIAGTPVGPVQTGVTDVVVGTNQLVPLGLVHLPGAVMGTDGSARLTFKRTSGTGVVSADEIWAFGVDEDSSLTIVDCGTGTPAGGGSATNLWIHAPSATKPAGEVLIGTAASNARWPADNQSEQVHKFPVGGVSMLTVTTNASGALTNLTHYRRWTHHAST